MSHPLWRRTPLNRALTAALALLAAGSALPALAAEAGVETLEEVVVTSRNRKELNQDVPLPTSVVGSKELERDNATTGTDFARKLPSVSLVQNQPRQSSYSIRGIGKNNSGEALEGSVGVIVDGVYYVHPGSIWGNFFDLDRVEVARGPQGTLLGKSTTLGVVNIATKAPSFTPGLRAEVGYGERNTVRTAASATGPLVDGVLAYRATVGYENGDGPIKNDFKPGETLNDLNRRNARLQLLFTPTADITARISADYARSDQYNVAWTINLGDPATFTNGNARSDRYSDRIARFGAPKNKLIWNSYDSYASSDMGKLVSESKGWSGTVDWKLANGYTLTGITAARNYLFAAHNDYTILNDGWSGGWVQTEQTSHELRLTSPIGGKVDYQAGLYYLDIQHQTGSTPGTTFGADSGTFQASSAQYNALKNTAVGRSLLAASLDGVQTQNEGKPGVRNLAYYGQLNWHLTDRATLTAGIRLTDEKRTNSYQSWWWGGTALTAANFSGASTTELNAANGIRNANARTTALVSTEKSDRSVSWLLNPSYKLSDDVLLYASTAYGEKSGAVQFTSAGALQVAKPEKVQDYELGFKSYWLNRRLRVNANLFYTDIKDYQTQIRVVDAASSSGYSSYYGNADKVVTKGVEFDLGYAANERWTLTALGAWNPARYTSWKNGVCPAEVDSSAKGTPVCDLSGQRVGGASDLSLSLGVDYRAPLAGTGLTWRSFLNNTYRSASNVSPTLSAYGQQPAYSILDGGIGISSASGKYDLSLVGKNLLDKQYLISVQDLGGSSLARGAAGQRRFIGLTFRASL